MTTPRIEEVIKMNLQYDDFSAKKTTTNWKQRKEWMIERLAQLMKKDI